MKILRLALLLVLAQSSIAMASISNDTNCPQNNPLSRFANQQKLSQMVSQITQGRQVTVPSQTGSINQ
jgi:hypothetical protein